MRQVLVSSLVMEATQVMEFVLKGGEDGDTRVRPAEPWYIGPERVEVSRGGRLLHKGEP
jgi:hypothetical protein